MKLINNLKKIFKPHNKRRRPINAIALAIVAFIIAAIAFNRWNFINLNARSDVYDEELESSFPILYQVRNDKKINEMRGFVHERYNIVSNDTITILNRDRKLNLLIKNNGNRFNTLNYEVRDRTGNRLLERTRLEIYESNKDTKNDETNVTLNIQNLILPNTTYLLTIKLNIKNKVIYYFTNIISRTSTDIDDAIFQVTDFTDRTFRPASASEVVKYLETSINRDLKEMYNVTLQQSFEQLTFANTGMQRISEYYYSIYQAQEFSYNIAVRYLTESTKTEHRSLFINRDEYVLRWDGTRWYYMKLNRHTEELLDLQNEPFNKENNRFYLGVTNPNNLVKIESENKRFFAFCKQNEVYVYDNDTKTMTSVFAHRITDKNSFEKVSSNYDIKLMNIDNNGNVVYIIYGYNMSGRNEGNMGINIFTYSASTNTSIENIFLPIFTTFQSLKYDMSRLCIFKNNSLIFKSYNKVYSIDIDTSEMLTIADGFEETKFAASTNGKYFAFNNDKSGVSKQINIYNIDEAYVTEINAVGDEYIEVVTFLNDDLFYGVFKDEDIWREAGKIIGRPSREIRVVNAVTGKEDIFSEEGSYFYNFVNQQNLLRYNKYTRDGTHYTYKTNDVIINNFMPEFNDAYFFKEELTKDRLRIGYFEIPMSRTEEMIYAKNNGISRKQIEEPALESYSEQEELIYYVYDSGNLKGKIKILSDGINEIRDNYGYVKLSDRITCYNRTNKSNFYYLRQDDSILENLEGFEENVYIKDNTMLVMNVTGITERDLEYYISLKQKVAVYKNDLFQFFITGYDNNFYILEYTNRDRIQTPRIDVHEVIANEGYVLFAQLESLE